MSKDKSTTATEEKAKMLNEAFRELTKHSAWPLVKMFLLERKEVLHRQASAPFFRITKTESVEKYISAQSHTVGCEDELTLLLSLFEGSVTVSAEEGPKG